MFDVFNLVANFFGFSKIVSFVELGKLYQMVYKRNQEKI
jgi:hypothetical protein